MKQSRQTESSATHLLLAQCALMIFRRGWFREVTPKPELPMAMLLLDIYASSLINKPLTQREIIGANPGAKNSKTTRKYLKRAIQLGLVAAKSAPSDRRSKHLHPTERLRRIAVRELETFKREFSNMARDLVEPEYEEVTFQRVIHAFNT